MFEILTTPYSIILALILAVSYQKYANPSFESCSFSIQAANRRSVSISAAADVSSRVATSVERDAVYKESDISVTLKPVWLGFTAPVKIDNQSFDLLVDTASSDTWVVDSFFTCLSNLVPNRESEAFNPNRCLVGPTYHRGLDSSFRSIGGYSFKLEYGSTDSVGGPLGYAQVDLADNLTIPAQQIGLASALVQKRGDGVTSGILGLGFPGLTHRFKSTNFWEDIPCFPGFVYPCNQGYYQSITWSLFKNFTTADNIRNEALLSEEIFSLTLARNTSGSGGLMTFGGLPDLSLPIVNTTMPFTRVPLEIKKYDDDYRHYIVSTSSFTYGAIKSLTTAAIDRLQLIVDAGSIWNLLPYNVSSGINLSFLPPASRYFADNASLPLNNLWEINCTEYTAPEVGIELGGQIFWHNKEDLVRRFQVIEYSDEKGNGIKKEVCISTIQDGVDGAFEKPNSNYMLGQPFLTNVLAVFDIGRLEMGFAARTEYR